MVSSVLIVSVLAYGKVKFASNRCYITGSFSIISAANYIVEVRSTPKRTESTRDQRLQVVTTA